MASDDDDAELVRRCLEGEEAAWSRLVRRYADLVYGLARGAGLQGDAADDVVQEVGVILLRSLPRLRDRGRLFPWIVRTARREAWKQRRRARATVRRESAAARAEGAPGASADETLRALEDEQAVREAMDALSERCRRLLRALYFEENPAGYDDVAERLGVPRGSIGPTRSRCLESLREALAALGFRPESDVSGGRAAVSTPRKARR